MGTGAPVTLPPGTRRENPSSFSGTVCVQLSPPVLSGVDGWGQLGLPSGKVFSTDSISLMVTVYSDFVFSRVSFDRLYFSKRSSFYPNFQMNCHKFVDHVLSLSS